MFCFVTASPSPGPTSETEGGLPDGAVAGIVIGVTAIPVSVVIVVLIVAAIVYRSKKSNKRTSSALPMDVVKSRPRRLKELPS